MNYLLKCNILMSASTFFRVQEAFGVEILIIFLLYCGQFSN